MGNIISNFKFSAAMLFCMAVFLFFGVARGADVRPQVFFQAHRGGVDEMPENTLAAFRFSWSIPGAVPEVDVQTTSDGVMVCMHDDTPKRTTNAPPEWEDKSISEIPVDVLRRWDAGGYFGQAYTGEKAPLLDELFEQMKGHPERQLYLDIKAVDLDKLLEKIHASALEKQVIFVHGEVAMCKKLQGVYPGARTMTWISGTPKQQKDRFEALAADNFAGISQLQFHLQHTKRTPEIVYALDDEYLKEAVRRTREAGVELQLRPFLFTPESLKKLVELGVHWFVADAPNAFHKALMETDGVK